MIPCRHPSITLIDGPTQACNSFFFKQIVELQLIQPSPSRVISVHSDRVPNLPDPKHLYPTFEYVQGI